MMNLQRYSCFKSVPGELVAEVNAALELRSNGARSYVM